MEKSSYLCAATARLLRYFCAVMTPTNRKLLDREPGFSVAGEPLSGGGHCSSAAPARSFLCAAAAAVRPQAAGLSLRACPPFFSSVALGRMSLDARVKPSTSPSRTLNQALLLRAAIPLETSPVPPPPLLPPRPRCVLNSGTREEKNEEMNLKTNKLFKYRS